LAWDGVRFGSFASFPHPILGLPLFRQIRGGHINRRNRPNLEPFTFLIGELDPFARLFGRQATTAQVKPQ